MKLSSSQKIVVVAFFLVTLAYSVLFIISVSGTYLMDHGAIVFGLTALMLWMPAPMIL